MVSIPVVIRISPKTKSRVHLSRYLLSKLVYEENKFGLQDLACLFENQLWLEEKSSREEEFLRKHGKFIENLSIILKKVNFRMRFSQKALRRFSKRIKEELDSSLIPRRNYKETKSRYSGVYYALDPELPGIETKKLPAKARIGKGYGDKGSLKNTAKDGSPDWREVAMHRGPLSKGESSNETRTKNLQRINRTSEITELRRKIREFLEEK